MKFTIIHNSGGNHGHQLKDHLGGRTIGKLLNLDYLHCPYAYLNIFGLYRQEKKISKYDRFFRKKIRVCGPTWNGFVSYAVFKDYFDAFLLRQKKEYIVTLEKAIRVLPHQAIPWYKQGLIDRDVFSEIVSESSMKYAEENSDPYSGCRDKVIHVAMHVSRGVDYDAKKHPGHFRSSREPRYMFDLDYFERILQQVVSVLGSRKFKVSIFTENKNSEEIAQHFSGLNNIVVVVGKNRDEISQEDVRAIFNQFVFSDILISCNSGFSTMATYFRGERPTIYHPHYHLEGLPECPYLATDVKGNFRTDLLDRLLQNNCKDEKSNDA